MHGSRVLSKRRAPVFSPPETCASGTTKRVAFAVGDGALAVACAHRVLAEI